MSTRQFGPRPTESGPTESGTTFRLWAPAAKRVDLLLDQPHPMQRRDDGWFVAEIPGTGAGTRYKFRIDDEIDVPDPASDFQPEDVSGPSEIIDHAAYRWRTTGWGGRPGRGGVALGGPAGTLTPPGDHPPIVHR